MRESVVDRLNRELAIRDIEALADEYAALLARTHPHQGVAGWLAHLRRQIDGIRDVQDATELLSDILEALDEDGVSAT
jgi:hypothetical protein